MHSTLFLALCASLSTSVLAASAPKVTTFGPKAVKGPVGPISLVAEPNSLDAPKILETNSSVYEWWYFDVLDEDYKTSLQVIFFNALPSAFPFIEGDPSAVSVTATFSLPNGTVNGFLMPASEAKISWGGAMGNAASGKYTGEGMQAVFSGTPNLHQYAVSFGWMDTYGLKADLVFDSMAPAHYGCTANLNPGQDVQVLPGLGWSNAIPLSKMRGSVTWSNGDNTTTTHSFSKGSVYHDKNWGVVPFYESANTWIWGRTSLGPYAIVFWHGLDAQLQPKALAYVSDTTTGKILTSNCVPGQTNATATYKDAAKTHLESLEVMIEIPAHGGKTEEMKLEIDVQVALEESPDYGRWTGKTSGGMVGGKQYEGGMAIFEQFPPPPKSG